MDINTRMYLGCGTSMISEQKAFFNALDMIRKTGVHIDSLRLDKYYSQQSYVEVCQENLGNVRLFLIPRVNATIKGSIVWKEMIARFIEDTKAFLEEYFQRNQSESGFSEDKKRTGWKISQKREERIDTADRLNLTWHNLFWLGD